MKQCEKAGSKKDYLAIRNFVEQSNQYREDLVKLLNLDFDNPSKELKEFAEKSNLDLKSTVVQENFHKVRKELIDQINTFYEKNFLSMDNKAVEERKKEERMIKKKKKMEAKAKDISTSKETSKPKVEELKQNKDEDTVNNKHDQNNKKTKLGIGNQLVFFSTIIMVVAIIIYVVNNILY